jgi:sigma-B regulation protein RsbU (phosphoserine phosphatase)
MPDRHPSSGRLVSGFSLLRYQLVLLLIALVVRILFWAFHTPTRLSSNLVFTFVAGNVAMVLILFGRPLFERRARPWNWIGYMGLLVCAGVVAMVAAELPVYFLIAPTKLSFLRSLIEDAPISLLITLITGIMIFAFADAHAHLKAHNEQLQSQVQLGLVERQVYQSDLQQGHEIQKHLLPRETPQLPGFQIACAWQPATTVSGDYFDVLALSKGKLGLCLADVSGKGFPAALLMANLQASVKAFTQDGGVAAVSPAVLCVKLNLTLCDNIAPGRFITFFYAVLDEATRMLKYENAGHCLPLLVHADGSIDFPAAYSGVLGLFSHWTYGDHDLQLKPGDALVLMTDGVLEAFDEKEEEFGYQRVIDSVLASRGQGAHGIRKRVLEDVTAFCKGHFDDDASLIVVAVD